MTEEEKQIGLELQAYIESVKDMTLKEIAIQHLKKYHLPKFLSGLLVKFSYPLLLAKDYQLSEAENYNNKLHDSEIEKHNRIIKLQQENIALKNKCEQYESGYAYNRLYELRAQAESKLDIAKELLKRCHDDYIYLQPLRSEIEQFLANNF